MTRPTSSRATRYTVQGVLALGAVSLGVWGISMNIGSDARAQAGEVAGAEQEVDPLEPAVYGHLQKLRRSTALTAGDLAALDLTQAEAESVLMRLGTWCKTNHQRLAEAESAQLKAQRDLDEYHRMLRTGESAQLSQDAGDDRVLALKTAFEARQSLLLEGASDAIQAVPSKVNAWRASSAVRGLPPGLRHLSTMDAERLKQLRDSADRQGQALDEALTYQEKQELAALHQRIASRQPAISAAEQSALPAPEALRGSPRDDAGTSR